MIIFFYSHTNPDRTSEERTFEEDIEMRADDVGTLRNSRVEVAENYEERIDNAKGKLATLLETMNNMFAERIPHDVEVS